MSEPDLDDSIAVDILTYGLYVAWLMAITAVALWFGLPPLPDIVAAIQPPWLGTLAALSAGALFLGGSRWLYDRFIATRPEEKPTPTEPAETPEPPEEAPEDTPAAPKRKRKKKKKKKKRR